MIQQEEKIEEPAPVEPEPVVEEEPMNLELDDEDFDDDDDDLDEFDDFDFEPEPDIEEEPIEEDPLEERIQELEAQIAELHMEQQSVTEEESSNEQALYDLNPFENDIDSFQSVETCIEINELEETYDLVVLSDIQELILPNLPNESYDDEFEPKDEPIEASFHIDSNPIIIEDESSRVLEARPIDTAPFVEVDTSISVEEEPLVPIVEEKVETAPFVEVKTTPVEKISLVVEDQQTINNDAYMIVPKESVEDFSHSPSDVTLEKNPYFRNKKMNVSIKPVIVSLISIILFIGVFISIFAIIHAFK